ncbi:FAD/NAD(P)-binding domain-containing protein [Xylaria intraflava]|nr:FAD/NAD(P)-binding domain-containing protein [Xylaria intraflava]
MSSEETHTPPARHIAIVGGGISGMACAWKLRNYPFIVDIFESDSKLGGHANSVLFEGNGRSVSVDTGFIAMDETTYPQFNSFLRELSVETIPTDMSFGVSTIDGGFEWGSHSFMSFIGRLSNLLRLSTWRLLFDIARFSLFAADVLREEYFDPREAEWARPQASCGTHPYARENRKPFRLEPIGDYLRAQNYSERFISLFLIPMVAAPWCIDPDEFSRTFPARSLIKFMLDHRLLDTPLRTLRWRSFRNGSQTYVNAFQNSLPRQHKLYLNTTVQSVRRTGDGVSIKLADGSSKTYDHVVLAIHANQALRVLGSEATDLERTLLGNFKTTRNTCYLHSDTSFLPKRPSARVAWNCFLENSQPREKHDGPEKPSLGFLGNRISITFDMNRLQAIPMPEQPGSPGRVLVSMNPLRIPQSHRSRQAYYHPLISSESISMAPHLNLINGVRGISFAGAWMGFGFHEDGFAAGAHVAQMLVAGRENTSWLNLVSGTDERCVRRIGALEWAARMVILAVQWLLVAWDT